MGVEGHASTASVEGHSCGDQYTHTFTLLPTNAIFAPIAIFPFDDEKRWVPIRDDEASPFPDDRVCIIQLSASSPPGIIPCSISHLPAELLCVIFGFVDDASILSDVCQLWRVVSAPYWDEPDYVEGRYARLKRYPGAGRLWGELTMLRFGESISVWMVKDVIVGSPNVTRVRMDACWNEEDAKIVLNAIVGLTSVNDIAFGQEGWRKWKKEEVENFMRRTCGRTKRLTAWEVEDSASSASTSLRLPHGLEYLDLDQYPPLPSLSLPPTLRHLQLSNMCPLPPSISDHPLPPHLEHVTVELTPSPPADRHPSSPLRSIYHISHTLAP
ncbi:hypothetical protein BT69DRAFT_1283121 [Atractiella rhizophila]|nr:hypothetical protein BT69DRAFT_1283121 [Atractiella rhizophila]